MNTIKNSEEKERMNECRKGGAAVLWGVQKIKEKNKKQGARVGPWCNWVWVWAGSTHEPWVGSEEV